MGDRPDEVDPVSRGRPNVKTKACDSVEVAVEGVHGAIVLDGQSSRDRVGEPNQRAFLPQLAPDAADERPGVLVDLEVSAMTIRLAQAFQELLAPEVGVPRFRPHVVPSPSSATRL